MEAVIFIGIQGSGKSSFYKKQFIDSHIRINLDMLKTRHREQIILQACLEAKQRFVIDNTNPTVEDRSRYIQLAKQNYFRVVGYYFPPDLEGCKRRNSQRHPQQIVPLVGVLATYKKLVIPTWEEGFDALYSVEIGRDRSSIIKEWQD
jgi:predicted kinase